jgi:hypothetical protein
MSFELLEKDALLKIAEELAVDVNPSWTPAEFAKEFDEVGVEWDLVKSSVPSVAKALAKAEKEARRMKTRRRPKSLRFSFEWTVRMLLMRSVDTGSHRKIPSEFLPSRMPFMLLEISRDSVVQTRRKQQISTGNSLGDPTKI